MTKTKVLPSPEKEVMQAEIVMPPTHQAAAPQPTGLYALSILATIFCCLPCGVIGLVHTMIAGHEAERGNLSGYQRRVRQGKCWTGWALGIGLSLLVLVAVHFALGCPYLIYIWSMYEEYYDYDRE